MYRKFGKRILDILLSGCGVIILSPLYLILAIAIKIDDPGPIFFHQKRVGLHKTHFQILKFRTMKMCTPHDVPTHQLQNPEQYITSVGKLLRKTSLDERDKYGANDIRPGLTGWAQINGRDELPIDVKAKLDGEYAQNLSFAFDCRCFFGSITAVLKHKGVVEGGTGAMDKEHQA